MLSMKSVTPLKRATDLTRGLKLTRPGNHPSSDDIALRLHYPDFTLLVSLV